MHGGGARFFGGCGSELIELAFDLAYFYHVHPDTMLDKPVSELDLYWQQAKRINDRMNER